MQKIKWTTRAAFVALAVIITMAMLTACKSDTGSDTGADSETASEKLPALFYSGNIYVSDGYGSYGTVDILPEGYAEAGKIQCDCGDELPDEELEARGIAVGDVVYASADNSYAVYVLTDGELFRYLVASSFSG